MTKQDITDQVQAATEFTSKEAAELTEAVFSIIKDTLEQGENIKISGFGNFTVKEKTDRRGRNPQTGEDITIAARRILTFKPSAVLKSAVNREVKTGDTE